MRDERKEGLRLSRCIGIVSLLLMNDWIGEDVGQVGLGAAVDNDNDSEGQKKRRKDGASSQLIHTYSPVHPQSSDRDEMIAQLTRCTDPTCCISPDGWVLGAGGGMGSTC